MQDDVAHIVLDNPRFERMAPEPTPSRGEPALGRDPMPDAKKAVREEAKPGAAVMQQFRETELPPSNDPRTRHEGEMVPHTDTPGDVSPGGYVRLRVRVTSDQMRIVGAARVDGPLAQSAGIVGDHAYEVTLDGQLISREGLPDIGVSRAYPRPGQVEHHLTERPSVEFNIRVPLDRLPESALARLRLSLFSFPDASSRKISGLVTEQFGQQAKLVAHLDGVSQARLEPAALEQLRRIFPSYFRSQK
jgi:hypothetical protein